MINKLVEKIKKTGAPIVVGLDPMLNYIPQHVLDKAYAEYGETLEGAAEAVWQFNKEIVDKTYDLIPAVKPQIAMYEQFGIPGLMAFKKTVQTIVYLPHFMSWVVVAAVFKVILSVNSTGVVNGALINMGLINSPIDFLGSSKYWTGTFFVMNIWKDTGWGTILFLATLSGISPDLYEAAQIDGCSPMGIFFKIVLPLSRAALASIGLMFAVTFWNDYTNFKIYIRTDKLYNFQIKLRNMVMDSNIPNDDSVDPNTISNAATIVAILPFMIIYPFCQQYFVQGVNVGAVKE